MTFSASTTARARAEESPLVKAHDVRCGTGWWHRYCPRQPNRICIWLRRGDSQGARRPTDE